MIHHESDVHKDRTLRGVYFADRFSFFRLFGVLLIALLVGTVAYDLTLNGSYEFGLDFLAYWGSWKILSAGQNFYDHELLIQVQKTLGDFTTWRMNYLPWVVVILIPILNLPWCLSVAAMAAFNTMLFFECMKGAYRALQVKRASMYTYLLVVLLCVPLHLIFHYGQLGLYVTAATYTALSYIGKRRDFLAGVVLSVTTIKPHLLYLLLTWILCRSVFSKRLKILGGFLFGVIVMILTTWFFNHEIFSQWWHGVNESNPLCYLGVSLITLIRILFHQFGQDGIAVAVGYLIPGSLVLLTVYRSYCSRGIPNIEDKLQVVPLLFLSVLFAPYIWVHDMVILLIAQVGIIEMIKCPTIAERKRAILVASLLTCSITTVFAEFSGIVDFRLLYYPVAMMAIWCFAVRSTQLKCQ